MLDALVQLDRKLYVGHPTPHVGQGHRNNLGRRPLRLGVLGGATQGRTKEEALARINEVIELILEELLEEGEPIPEDVQVSQDPLVAVTI